MSYLTTINEQPLTASGGVTVTIGPVEDPYRVLDDLMTVVEALCPVWPQRPTFTGEEQMLL